MGLDGKVAVVTGGARGLGRAIALRLARDGVAVAVWDLQQAGAEESAALITRNSGRAIACAANAASAPQIAAAAARTRNELGPVTILVNNAALSPFAPFETITEEIWDDLMAVNLKGPFLCTRAIIPDMLAAGCGRIINISSSSAQTGAARQTHYAASKAGVIGFTKALAMEYATKGIAAAVAYLASEDADYVTGHTLSVNGGRYLN